MTWRALALKALTFTTLAIGAAAVLTGCVSSSRVAKTEADHPPIGQFVDVEGRKVHYVQDGTGPHVVLLHGAGGNLKDFTFDLMGRLTEDYTVTVFDRPGHGYTDHVPQLDPGFFTTEGDSPQDQAAMLRAAAAQIGIESPVVAGHSFGGIVAMAWANHGLDVDAPENAAAVVSFAGVSMPWPGDLDTYYTFNSGVFGGRVVIPVLTSLATDKGVAETVTGIFAPDPMPAGYVAHISADLILRPASFRANVRQVNSSRPHVVEMAKRYPELTLPIEVIHGTADTTVPITVHPMELRKIVPSVNLVPLEGTGHMPHLVVPEAAVDAINRAASRAGLR